MFVCVYFCCCFVCILFIVLSVCLDALDVCKLHMMNTCAICMAALVRTYMVTAQPRRTMRPRPRPDIPIYIYASLLERERERYALCKRKSEGTMKEQTESAEK